MNQQIKLKNTKVKGTFKSHLLELRGRFLFYILVLLGGSTAGYFVRDQILNILVKPLGGPLYFSSPSGGFELVIKVSIFFGFIVSLPIFIYQFSKFIQPAFLKNFPNSLLPVLLESFVLLLLGMGFAYFISLPKALEFLNTFTTSDVSPLISTNEYFSFASRYIFGFGLIFQMPLVMYLINTIHKISVSQLMKYQKYIITFSFVVAAILTPTPDFFNQIIMALPIIMLYQITLIMLWIINAKKY